MKELSETANAILGLLSLQPDSSGYDLGTFAQHSIAHFWPITRAHIYNELARLERDGYVTSQAVTQEKLPDKRVFRLTDSGVGALDAWLGTGAVPPERRRNPLLLRLFFANRMPPGRLAELLERHRERVLAERERYVADVELAPPDRLHMRSTALYGMRRVEADLAWLDDVEQLLLPPELRPARGAIPSESESP
jgi:PadR family transcriptional regulator AphA